MSEAWTILPVSFPLSTRGSSVELVLLQEHVKMQKSLPEETMFLLPSQPSNDNPGLC